MTNHKPLFTAADFESLYEVAGASIDAMASVANAKRDAEIERLRAEAEQKVFDTDKLFEDNARLVACVQDNVDTIAGLAHERDRLREALDIQDSCAECERRTRRLFLNEGRHAVVICKRCQAEMEARARAALEGM